MARERELKRRPKDHDRGVAVVEALLDLCGRPGREPVTKRTTSRYLDTRSGVLRRGGVGLRARGDSSESRACWTVKVGAIPDQRGLSVAHEFEVRGIWQEIPAEIALSLSLCGVDGDFVEIVRFTTTRQLWDASFLDARLEICLDLVAVEHPCKLEFVEVEVESIDQRVLERLGDEIDRRFPDVPPSAASKLATALKGCHPDSQGAGYTSVRMDQEPDSDLGERLAGLLELATPLPTPWRRPPTFGHA